MSEGHAGQRDAHATRMDGMYRYQRHVYDLTRKYYLLGRDAAIRGLDLPANGTLLEVGCGTGRNLAVAQRHFPQARLFGLDISREMLISARKAFAGRAATPHFMVADATRFKPGEFGVDGFDRILVSYALSMIPDWEGAIDAALAALNPGGQLHVVDFGQQERLPAWFRSLLRSWLARFHVTPRADLRTVLENRAAANGLTLHFRSAFAGYAWHATLSRNA